MSAQAVQVLQLGATTDKTAALDALVTIAHHNDREIVRLAAGNHSQPTPFGALAMIDDDAAITFDQLQSAFEEAERTNSKAAG